MELSPSLRVANSAATQELPSILWNTKVHYRVHKSPPLVPNLSQINPIMESHPISLRSILILSTHLRLGLPSGLFQSSISTNNLHAFLFSPIRVTCPAHLILLDLIILIILVTSIFKVEKSASEVPPWGGGCVHKTNCRCLEPALTNRYYLFYLFEEIICIRKAVDITTSHCLCTLCGPFALLEFQEELVGLEHISRTSVNRACNICQPCDTPPQCIFWPNFIF
jgi:hypothetical protein